MYRRIWPGDPVELQHTAAVHLGAIGKTAGTQRSRSSGRLHTVIALSIFILIVGKFIRTTCVYIRSVLDTHTLLGAAFLGGDQHHTVGRLTAIECRSRTTFQDGNTGDIIRVEIRDTITPIHVQCHG